jgi:hypothetical protein
VRLLELVPSVAIRAGWLLRVLAGVPWARVHWARGDWAGVSGIASALLRTLLPGGVRGGTLLRLAVCPGTVGAVVVLRRAVRAGAGLPGRGELAAARLSGAELAL